MLSRHTIHHSLFTVHIPVLLLVVLAGCSRQGDEKTNPTGTNTVSGGVAKVIVTVEKDGVRFYLLSRKNAPGQDKHGYLELLGGRVENETPAAAAARELAEEEKTGRLAKLFSAAQSAERVIVDGEEHHIFRLAVSPEDYLLLEPDSRESLGFKLVPAASLGGKQERQSLTKRTRRILKAVRPEP